MGELSSTTHRKKGWLTATLASITVNQELGNGKRKYWDAGRKERAACQTHPWGWEALIWHMHGDLLLANCFPPVISQESCWTNEPQDQELTNSKLCVQNATYNNDMKVYDMLLTLLVHWSETSNRDSGRLTSQKYLCKDTEKNTPGSMRWVAGWKHG